ncbi:MAG: ribbon-helix-helix domain-containing protein [Promethearchaeota archaeon]
MATIPINIDDVNLKKIDYLVKKGHFKNRSQAIRSLLFERLNKILLPFERECSENNENIAFAIKKLMNLKNPKVIIKSDKTASILIDQERERY